MIFNDSDYLESTFLILEGLDTAISLSCAILARYQEWEQLAQKGINPHEYIHAHTFKDDSQAIALFAKLDCLPLPYDKAEKALGTSYLAEELCCKTNARLSRFIYNGPFNRPDELRIANFLDNVKKRIKKVLGPCPNFTDVIFGNGATYNDRGRYKTIYHKLESGPTLTPGNWVSLSTFAGTHWNNGSPVEVVRGNRFTTVPKNSKTDRGIAVEPSLNVSSQLAAGRYIKRRLLRAGIDLYHGQDLHRSVVQAASRDASLATIDLSMASDTVCYNLVKLLLPSDWFQYLDLTRSPTTTYGGTTHFNAKFSSMGNGYTFELESLLFFCICSQVLADNGVKPRPSENIFTYGDDIICPNDQYRNISAVLEFLGFKLNQEKSYCTSYFRESCGGDFFNGVDVRPHYQKCAPQGPTEWYAFYNGIHRRYGSDPRFRHFRRFVLGRVPVDLRLRVPKVLGDCGFVSDEPGSWTTKHKDGIYFIRCLFPKFRKLTDRRFRPDVQLGAALYGLSSAGVDRPGSHPTLKKRWVAYTG